MIEIYEKIYKNMLYELEKEYIEKYKGDLNYIIEDERFRNHLKDMIFNNQYDSLGLMELLHPIYTKYWDVNSLEWLQYVYHWVLNLSYPEKNTTIFNDKLEPLVLFYLNMLRNFSKLEIIYDKNSFLNKFPISFLTTEEEQDTKFLREYLAFKDGFLNNWIYELMKMDLSLTGHNTLEHVVGVNYLSLYIGRQLKKLNLPIDLGLIVGAGLGHDIGKYGVKQDEIHHVPYLHYYYTEQWFNKLGIEKIGHIATNHSTWDLELENLPLESLVLIYADFRVKNKKIGKEDKMHIYSLEEAYDVILNKLDNVDEKKEQRYEKVYGKLKDFEDYMVYLGVDISLKDQLTPSSKDVYFSLMNNDQVVEHIKYFAIEHNIDLMAKLLDDNSFNNILDTARSQYNWRKLRMYLQIFYEYSTYLTQKQKLITLHFLEDLLFHKEEDIRKEAAELIGLLISQYDEEYRKELPKYIDKENLQSSSNKILENILDQILYPDHKIAELPIEWQYNIKTIIKSLFHNSPREDYEKYSKVMLKYYDNYSTIAPKGQFYLAQTIKYIPTKYLLNKDLDRFHIYILNQLDSNYLEIRLTTLDIIDEIFEELQSNIHFIQLLEKWVLKNIIASPYPAENYLKYKIALKLNLEKHILQVLKNNYKKDEENVSNIFLKNLKTATDWMSKKINIDILYDQVKKSPHSLGLHTGMHFCNLLKVSAFEKVRNYAGHTLLNIFEFLTYEERNDICIELLRALEMQNYQFTKYIPDYLGKLILYLPPNELEEIIDDFENKVKQSNTQIVFLLLKTTGICIENYSGYNSRFQEDKYIRDQRLNRLLGILLNGMASFDKEINTESFRIIGSHLFNSNKLSLKEKKHIFSLMGKKILTLLAQKEDDEFLFLINSASLNHIYRFISDYEFYYGAIKGKQISSVAFFPGSFDPFSLSHKEIALEIRDKGYEVYLAVDEFSWSKRTQAHKFRRDIINMTIAHEKDIYLFPSEIPINISNDKDLKKLKNLFPKKEIYIVIGTDVLINASAYSKDGLITQFPHIIFHRKSLQSEEGDDLILKEKLKMLKGKILMLSLPPQYEDISSTQIRESIDLNRDISKQIDPLAQQYIYKYGLYLREPQYKRLVQTKTLEVEIIDKIDNNILNYIYKEFRGKLNIEFLSRLKKKLEPNILMIKDTKNDQMLGFSTFYWVKSGNLFDEFENSSITQYIRNHAKGKLVVISGVYSKNKEEYIWDIVLNETLAHCVASDYNYAIYKDELNYNSNFYLEENLPLQGFIKTPFKHNYNSIFVVDMNNPITLNQDLENLLKPPYDEDFEIKDIINKTRKELKKAISNLYPGQLLLSFNRDMVYSKLIQKICDSNQVSTIQGRIKKLGPNMCVPFGTILNGTILPNTVTKTMHTEKIFNSSITNFTIQAFPNYLSLENQAKVLSSFNRPIILVDDLLHKGYRINVIEPILKNAGIKIKKIIVGILTGKGKEIGNIKNIQVDSAYFVPNLKLWFNESDQYPFIGGDMVFRKNEEDDYLIPSINLILPYASPSFIKNTSPKAIYNLSKTCLENSKKIFETIEKSYQNINEKNLTLWRLGEVLMYPRKPDIYKAMDYKNLRPSTCIEMDLEHLKRLENIIH